MAVYYNEFDPFAAAWLRELIKAGHLADGEVDERDMREVTADEIKGFTQWHFFAGIGGWAHALRLAGWPDDRHVLTGSPPCQPFSTAGKQLGVKDERHLAPHFLELVAALRPPVVFGEQVAAAIRKDNWLDDLLDELEREGYATGAIVLPACGIGAPHIRQRLWFVGRLADGIGKRLERSNSGQMGQQRQAAERGGSACGMAKPDCPGSQPRSETAEAAGYRHPTESTSGTDRNRPASPTHGGWSDPDWLFCRDGKWRPVEPGTFPLAHGVPARVGRLRGYGNAIVPQVAQAFIEAYMSTQL